MNTSNIADFGFDLKGACHEALALALNEAHAEGAGEAFSLSCLDRPFQVRIAFKGHYFTGDYADFKSSRVQWLKGWHSAAHLHLALEMWNVPTDSSFDWALKTEQLFHFYRAAERGLIEGFQPKPDPKPEPEVPKRNCVYFVQARHLGLIKIGFSGNPQKRLRSLKTGSPDELSILKVIKGSPRLEAELHRRFVSDRVRGEWFKPSPALLSFIENLKD